MPSERLSFLLLSIQMRWVFQGREPADAHPSLVDLVQPNHRLRSGGKEVAHARIDFAAKEPLKERVVWMRVVRLLPDPFLRPQDVVPNAHHSRSILTMKPSGSLNLRPLTGGFLDLEENHILVASKHRR